MSLACDSQKAREHLDTAGGRHRGDLAHQTALADARWSHHADHRAMAIDRAVQQASTAAISQRRPTRFDSARPTSRSRRAMPSSRRARHRFVGTLDANQLGLAQSRRALDQPRGGRAEHHPARRGHRFHPLRHPDLLTDGGVTQRARTDLTGNHLDRSSAPPATADRHRRAPAHRRPAAWPPPERPTRPGRPEKRGPPTPPARRTPP